MQLPRNILALITPRPPAAPAAAPTAEPVDHGPFVDTAFRRILRRAPTAVEREHYVAVTSHLGHAALLDLLYDGDEHQHRNRVDDRSEFYAGHYYSPVVDPEALAASGFRVNPQVPETDLPEIDLRPAEMLAFWSRQRAVMSEHGFVAEPTPGVRYHANNDTYSWGDAIVLLGMLSEARPRRVAEVGSGFSSACMLDIADRLGLPTRFTFIEPYPERLFGLLTDADRRRCEIIEQPVQQAPPEVFQRLAAGDILFIDSTHVSKAGSDVNHELFEILPRLASGVFVHFHDTFYPFEYPEDWTFRRRRSWNELYLLRAFLAYNRAFKVVFFNDYFRWRHWDKAREVAQFSLNPGGGLWLRKA